MWVYILAAVRWSRCWPWHLTTPPSADCLKAWSAGFIWGHLSRGCCYLSGANLPIKQIRLPPSPGSVLSGSFESAPSRSSHQHVHLSITFSGKERLSGRAKNANHPLCFMHFQQRTLGESRGGRETNKSKLNMRGGKKQKDRTIILIYFGARIPSDKGSKEWTPATKATSNLPLQSRGDYMGNYVVSYLEEDNNFG